MPVINGKTLLARLPIREMFLHKRKAHGTSYGLVEAGYDIRINQEVNFIPPDPVRLAELTYDGQKSYTDEYYQVLIREAFHGYTLVDGKKTLGRMVLASSVEEFDMPADLVGVVHDKSTWARQGLSVFNTVIEPGFIGGLTLELVFHGNKELIIPAGAPIAQVIFEKVKNPAQYNGKYQGQSSEPTPSKYEGK